MSRSDRMQVVGQKTSQRTGSGRSLSATGRKSNFAEGFLKERKNIARQKRWRLSKESAQEENQVSNLYFLH